LFDYTKCDTAHNIDSPSGRVYETPDGTYPSITTILGATSDKSFLKRWRDKIGDEEADRIVAEAASRGTAVHDYVERYFKIEDNRSFGDFFKDSGLLEEPINIKQPTRAIIKECERNNFKPYAQEIPLWHPKLKYAGRVDGIGLWNDTLSIIDFKTSKKKKYVSTIRNYYIQCTAYAVAHNYLFDTQINNFAIVIGGDQVDMQLFEGKVVNYIPELKFRVKQFYEQQKNNN
jgi:ATP-dependent exoDNAse (exonuclease V) beta subunit